MPSVFISAASGGLGLEFARQYAAQQWDVLAACCDPQRARDLGALGANVSVLPLDLADDRSIDELLRIISKTPLDVLIANTGVESGPPEAAGAVTHEAWAGVIGVHTFAPFRLATALRIEPATWQPQEARRHFQPGGLAHPRRGRRRLRRSGVESGAELALAIAVDRVAATRHWLHPALPRAKYGHGARPGTVGPRHAPRHRGRHHVRHRPFF